MKDIFLPPGVQMKLWERFGRCPREASEETAAKIEALWLRRNNAPEEELDCIDQTMEDLAVESNAPATITKPMKYAIKRHDGAIFPERYQTMAEAKIELDYKLGNGASHGLAWIIQIIEN